MHDDLLELLRRLNRKERFFLLNESLNAETFLLSKNFRDRIERELRLKKEIPDNALVAIDYHIDWISAALIHHSNCTEEAIYPNNEKHVKGSQQDVDLMVAFEDKDGVQHLIFLEAKGQTPWRSDQLRMKAQRFKLIFGNDGSKFPKVRPYFCLLSPKCPTNLKNFDWPTWWMNSRDCLNWLKMDIPNNLLRVARWDKKRDKSSRDGEHFRIVCT